MSGTNWERPRRQPERRAVGQRTAPATVPAEARGRRLALPVVLFLIALAVPLTLQVGGLRLSVYRIILLIMVVPLLFMWLSGRAGRIRLAEIALILLSVWASISLAVVHDTGTALEGGGIFFAESVGSFLLARCFVRDERSFRAVVKVLFSMVLFLAPFALLETLTGINLLMTLFGAVGETYNAFRMEPRLGLERVQSTFEHPILFGVFCASLIGLTPKVLFYRKSLISKFFATIFVMFIAFFSLSSGPFAGIFFQMMLLSYDFVAKKLSIRWWIAVIVGSFVAIVLELISNRTLPEVLISYFALSQYTAYLRMLIWDFGTISIFSHPWFGIGFNEYARPSWMSFSIDMFWIVFAIRHGIIAWILTFFMFFSVVVPVIFKKNLTDRQNQYRFGFVFSMIGLFLCGWAVHLWNAIYVLLLFLLGSGVWLLDVRNAEEAHEEVPDWEGSKERTRRRKPAGSQVL